MNGHLLHFRLYLKSPLVLLVTFLIVGVSSRHSGIPARCFLHGYGQTVEFFFKVFCWRKMEHKQPVQISGKTILTITVGVIGALALGVGMCFSMVWGKMVIGVIIGLIGIVILLSLIPLVKGIKD